MDTAPRFVDFFFPLLLNVGLAMPSALKNIYKFPIPEKFSNF